MVNVLDGLFPYPSGLKAYLDDKILIGSITSQVQGIDGKPGQLTD